MVRVASWCGAWLLYLLLAGQLSSSELLTGAVVVALVATWSAALRSASQCRFRFSRTELACWVRACLELPAASLRVGYALLQALVHGDLRSRARQQPSQYGAINDPVERSRRASAVLAASLTPPRFVVLLPEDEAHVLLHELATPARELDPKWLT